MGRHLLDDRVDAYSAGAAPHGIDVRAVKMMREVGVDMGEHWSKSVKIFHDDVFDLVVTVCDNAASACPVFSAAMLKLHRGFPDPPALARGVSNEEASLDIYRRVRDEIRDFMPALEFALQEHVRTGPSS